MIPYRYARLGKRRTIQNTHHQVWCLLSSKLKELLRNVPQTTPNRFLLQHTTDSRDLFSLPLVLIVIPLPLQYTKSISWMKPPPSSEHSNSWPMPTWIMPFVRFAIPWYRIEYRLPTFVCREMKWRISSCRSIHSYGKWITVPVLNTYFTRTSLNSSFSSKELMETAYRCFSSRVGSLYDI